MREARVVVMRLKCLSLVLGLNTVRAFNARRRLCRTIGVEIKGHEVTLVVEGEVSKVASLVEECYRAWRRAGELLDKLEEIAVRNCLDRYRSNHPDLSWFYDDQFEPLWTLEDEGYVMFRWAGRKLYLEARIYRNGRVECIARERTTR